MMVTVKTYPNPSETYGETVCVAGVRLDRGQPEWIRLYPVKFRNADFDSTFKKYEIIRVNGTYHQANDNRPEPFRPKQDELEHVEWLDSKKNWLLRRSKLGALIGETTMCELLARNPKGGDPLQVPVRRREVPRARPEEPGLGGRPDRSSMEDRLRRHRCPRVDAEAVERRYGLAGQGHLLLRG